MNKSISPKIAALIFGILAFSFLAAFYAVAWQEPTQAPTGGNVATPLNVGSTGQSKTGGLILNTGGAEYGLILNGFFKIPATYSNPNSSSLWIDADPDRTFLNQNAYYSPSSGNWQRFSGSYNSLGLWIDTNNGFVLKYASSTAGGSGDNSTVSWTEIFKVSTSGSVTAGGMNITDRVIPSGMISMFDASCPSGWTRFAALDGRFPQGAASYGGTGGSATHSHTTNMPSHYHAISGAAGIQNLSYCAGVYGCSSGQYYVGFNADRTQETSASGIPVSESSNLPPYLNVVWCKKN